jgi:hypothetical protein
VFGSPSIGGVRTATETAAMIRNWVAMAAVLGVVVGARSASAANDYPTTVVADYVIGCMASNGESQEMLRRCACSIDTVSSIVPYQTYERAETIMQMRLVQGEMTSMFREMKMLNDMVKQLRLAQIEADFRCF